ncbi:MAG: BrnT family toxin [Granulosicoccus sp.]
MNYVWDPQKRATNLQKHGIDFVDAVAVMEDERGLTKSTVEEGEYRFLTLGVGSKPGVLLVVHAEESSDEIAIISARRADRKERQQYYEGILDE